MGRTRHYFLDQCWSEGPGIKANKIHLQDEKEYFHSRILHGRDLAVPSSACWHVGRGQVELLMVAAMAASRGATGLEPGVTQGWVGWAFGSRGLALEELAVRR